LTKLRKTENRCGKGSGTMAAVSKSKGFEALGEIEQWVLLLQASEPNEPTRSTLDSGSKNNIRVQCQKIPVLMMAKIL